METRVSKIALILFAVCINFLGCSEDETPTSPGNTPGDTTGEEIYRSQLVTVDVGENLSLEEYEGSLNGDPLVLMRADDSKLIFAVPYTAALGYQDLIIPNLEFSKSYVVLETSLPGTPEETIEVLFDNFALFTQTLDDSPEALAVQDNIDNFTEVYQNLNDEEKKQMAIFYSANKDYFNQILLNDPISPTGRITVDDLLLITKHKVAAIVMAGGAYMVLFGEGSSKIAGIALVSAGAWKARSYFLLLANKTLNTIGVEIDNVMGVNGRNANSAIQFQSETLKVMDFYSLEKKLTTQDVNKTESAAITFFYAYNKYNSIVSMVNNGINWINDNIAMANFSLIPLEQLPASSSNVPVPVTQEILDDFNFSINHPNLVLEDISLNSEGYLGVKINVIGNPLTTPVQSFLNYTYSDEMSTFNGSIPIEVTFTQFLGMTLENKRDINVYLCGETPHSATFDHVFSFSGTTTPLGGTVLFKTIWDNDCDGTYDGNADGAFESRTITTDNSIGNQALFAGGFCWGNCLYPLVVLYQYISPSGVASEVMSSEVPQ